MANSNLDSLRFHLVDELIPDRRHEKGKYQCPLCGSGTGRGNSDGAFSIKDGIHGKCFSCGFYGDIFDLVSQREGITVQEATRQVIEKYGTGTSGRTATPFKPVEDEKQQPAAGTFTDYLASCHAALAGSDGEKYLRSRGIESESMERFNLGYDVQQRRITIPYDRRGTYYSNRAISNDQEPRHSKPKGVPSILFNAAAIYGDEPCFIVEAPLCAISVMQCGGSAIALSNTGSNALYAKLDKRKPSAPFILCLDNDQPKEDGSRPGQDAQEKLAAALSERGIPYIELNVAEDCKDPNELLQKDPDRLRNNVNAAILAAKTMMNTIRENEREEYEAATASASFADFERFLTENGKRPPVPTGFNELDKILNGGLTAGLYIMGAISSLGKTSWMLNIADNISAAGRDVLYFSLEMSRNELIAKSISRLTFSIVGERKLNMGEAMTTFEVMNSKRDPLGSSTLSEATDRYRTSAGSHLWIFEGVGNFGVKDITQKVEDHIRITGRKPVVFLDYLQILAPEDSHYTDKQNTDKAVVELKRLSAAYEIPIFCISSLNRLNYSEPITMSAFKESGAIEYGSDVLIGLQLYGIGYQGHEKQTEHVKRVRELILKAEQDPQIEIEVRVLKNRNGSRGGSGCLLFDKKYNSFREVPAGLHPVYIETPFDEDGEADILL